MATSPYLSEASQQRAFVHSNKKEKKRKNLSKLPVAYLVKIGAPTILGQVGSERCRIIRRDLEWRFPVRI